MPILNKRANKTPLGLYVHVPFCRSKCQYCDFYSMATKDDKLMDGYLDAVCDHIKEAGELAPGYKVDSVYFGGGTPSFFGADGLAVILTTIRRNFDVVPDADGRWLLMEAELIEPDFYLGSDPAQGDGFARALRASLDDGVTP